MTEERFRGILETYAERLKAKQAVCEHVYEKVEVTKSVAYKVCRYCHLDVTPINDHGE